MSDLRRRKPTEIITSTMNTDLLLVVEHPGAPHQQDSSNQQDSFFSFISKVGEELADVIDQRCSGVLPFFGKQGSSCAIDWENYKKRLEQIRRSLRTKEGIEAISDLEGEGKDYWNVPKYIYDCSKRLKNRSPAEDEQQLPAEDEQQLPAEDEQQTLKEDNPLGTLARQSCVALGRIDYYTALNLNHNYWENLGRLFFHDKDRYPYSKHIEKVLCIPAHRLKQSRVREDDGVVQNESHLTLEMDPKRSRLVTYSFFRFPPAMPMTKRGEQDHGEELKLSEFLQQLVNALVPHGEDEGDDPNMEPPLPTWFHEEHLRAQAEQQAESGETGVDRPDTQTPSDPDPAGGAAGDAPLLSPKSLRLQTFLTYSTAFPMLVRAEHKDPKQFSAYLKMLDRVQHRPGHREIWLPAVHTLVGFHDPELSRGNLDRGRRAVDQANQARKEGEKGKKDWLDRIPRMEADQGGIPIKEMGRFSLQLMVRYKSPRHEDVEDLIHASLKAISKGYVRRKSVLAQWRSVYEFVPVDVRTAVQTAMELNRDPHGWGIEKTALVTCLGQRNETQQDKGSPALIKEEKHPWFNELKNKIEESRAEAPHYISPDLNQTALDSQTAPVRDILNENIYDLKFHWEWLGSYLLQLQDSWEDLARRSTVPERCKANDPHTFRLMGDTVRRHIDLLLGAMSRLCGLRKVVGCEGLEQERREEARQLHLRAEETTWDIIDRSQKDQRRFKEFLAHLVSAYPERNEASLVVSQTEPRMHTTEPTGLLDMGTVAAHRTFRNYLTRPREWSYLDVELSSVDPDGNKPPSREKWQGKVLTSTGYDFMVQPHLQLLYVPVEFKLHTYARLQPLAHEAGHVVLAMLDRTEHSRAIIQDEVIKPWVEKARLIAEARLTQQSFHLKTVQKGLTRFRQRGENNNLVSLELLCDCLGALAAGPAYYSAIYPWFFNASVKKDKELHAELLVRLKAGVALAKALGWYRPETGSKHNPGGDPWCVFSAIEKSLIRHCKPGKNVPLMSTMFEYYLVEALEEDFNNTKTPPEYLINLLRFCETCGRDFLFYPHVEDPDEQQTIREVVNALCEKTMARMLFNNELVLDLPPKIIAAAAMLLPFGRPHHPGGRVLQSIFFTSGDPSTCWHEISKLLGDRAGLLLNQRIQVWRDYNDHCNEKHVIIEESMLPEWKRERVLPRYQDPEKI